MRFLPFIVSTAITLLLIGALNRKWGPLPPLGKFLSPQTGFWQNAEPIGKDYNDELSLPGLKGKVEVWLDDRMVPHIFAQQDADAYYAEGYLHARDRLWQMELQTLAAQGRLSEILGSKMLGYDREQRRMGMGYAAEAAAKEMLKDSSTRMMIAAYTAGINAYIKGLSYDELAVEYKLLDYRPEPWSAVKTGALLKYMSYDLAGGVDDLEYTNARRLFSAADFNNMYPDRNDSLDPVIPKGTAFDKPVKNAVMPSDSAIRHVASLLHFKQDKPDPDNGSNNWAVSGSKTRSGAPILCNDPHLGLSLPSLWYEVQLHTPTMNVYGASLPGAPGVVIGFNDNIAWGVTNGSEDVKDYYAVQCRNGVKQYLFNGQYHDAQLRIEEIKVRGEKSYYDTVAYTVWGPVMYEDRYPAGAGIVGQPTLALRWKAHDPSNEILTFYKLNHARTYEDYLDALQHYTCPAQNFIYASKTGDIALWHNGQYPMRWKDQGKWVMPGDDSSFAWQGYVPQTENPHIRNPARGFVSSANQQPTDSTYPYYYFGYYDMFRGKRINERLSAMNQITPQDMMQLQNDNANLFARAALPLLRAHLPEQSLTAAEQPYWQQLKSWNQTNSPDSKGATLFYLLWEHLKHRIWDDELMNRTDSATLVYPQDNASLLWLIRDSSMHFIDDVHTPQKETLTELVQQSFAWVADSAQKLDQHLQLEWGSFRGTDIRHLTRSLPAFSRMHLRTGGGTHIVNATKETHGPSWRMVVQLGPTTEAYGIYPGGQSGNPGSPYYDNAVTDWSQGKYYVLHVFTEQQRDDPGVKFRMLMGPEN
ncbi:penicillin acylase family protein [Chitinophaga agrisoli]|uniref:Penicillin acylase family protein n=1 Tax=Chitinophaga agrisoli TaxID=2607653 RepID=A0A5B2VMT9_9BACT|nr:penicillin acylase family protein [Chitinophaga agrisoli]KAA2239459.1 penicillin acylase family protein [Chitinophaga agrisoli]